MKETIILGINDLTGDELSQLYDAYQFIKFQRIQRSGLKKEEIIEILRGKGISSLEILVKRIKNDVPFTRTDFSYIPEYQLKKWLSETLEVPEQQTVQILELACNMGILQKSMNGNYK